jgi:hypothetical protein
MTNMHLSDSDIQLFVLAEKVYSFEEQEHYNSCIACQEKATVYSDLFAEIKQQKSPAFDFDLAGMVLKKLPVQHSKSRFDDYLVICIVAASLFLAGFTSYFFRTFLTGIFVGTEPMTILLILTTVVSILAVICSEMILRFHNQMKGINVLQQNLSHPV